MSKIYGKKIDNRAKILIALFFGFLLLSSTSVFTSGAFAQLGPITSGLTTATSGLTTATSGLTTATSGLTTNIIPLTGNVVIPVLPSPTGLTATTVSSSQISLNWNGPSNVVNNFLTGYMIERSTNGVSWSTIVSNTGTISTIYLDSGLNPSTTYIYRVSAVYAGGLTSSPSNTASATTQASTYQLTVSTQLNTGDPLLGMFTALRNSTSLVATGFSPATFVLNNGAQYTVGVGNFGTDIFDHWADTGSATNPRPVSISSDTQLTAIYRDTALTLAPSRGPAGTNVTATGTTFSPSTTITLSWDGTTLVTTTSNSTGGFTTTFQVPTASSGIHKVQATDGTKTHSAPFTVGPSPPTSSQPPTGLTASAISSSQINLSWTAPSDDGGSALTGYQIERSQDNGTTWSIIQSNTASTSTTYSDTGLSPSTIYTYRVSAINSVGTSTPSNTASATTQSATTLLSPTGLTATTVSSSQINLNWNAPGNSGMLVTGYMIERSQDGINWSTIVSNTGTTSTIYLDSGLNPSTTYTYRVSAVYTGGEVSPPSNTASATTQASTYQLTVSTQLNTGDPLLGMYIELRNSTSLVATGFSPATFVLNNGAQYTVGVGNFGTDIFDHWADTGSATNPRPVSISSDTQLTAIYRDTALTLAPSRGPAGTNVTATGTTFSPSTTITLSWDGTTLVTTTSNSTGGFTTTFQVPTASSGIHKVQATDGTKTHSAPFTVGPPPTLALNTNSANVGNGVRITGTNFAPTSQITISYDGTAIGVGQQNVDSGSTTPSVITTNSNGGFTAIISVLRSVSGTHTITAQDSFNDKSSQSIIVLPHVFIYPAAGHAGSSVLIPTSQGNGYAASSTITIKFDGTTITPNTAVTSDNTGNFGGSFVIPSGSSIGSHTIAISDVNGNTYSIPFNVTSSTTPTYKVQHIVTGMSMPDSFAFIPDNGPGVDGSGSFMVTEKNTGNVIVFTNSMGTFVRQTAPFVTIPNLQTGTEDNGVLGITFDPNWATSKMVYFYVTRNVTGNIFGEVIRYHATTVAGNIVADTSVGEQLILGNIPAFKDGHNGGHLKFDSQGNLYISTGDGWTFTAGQDLTTLQAKILKITPLASPVNDKLYSIPSTNPFASSTNTSIKKEIWGYGVRNPFAFDIDSQTGRLYVSDVGYNTWERIDDFTTASANAGWPNYESPPFGNPQNLANYTPQAYWFPHQGMEPLTGSTAGLQALTAGTFYHGTSYPSNLQGAYFFGDYGVGFIAALLPSSTATPTIDPASEDPKGQVVPIYYGLSFAPINMQVWNGKIYFLELTGNMDVLNYN